MAEHPVPPEETAEELRLAQALEDFCRNADAGQDPDPGEYVARHPDLSECLEGLAAMDALCTELQPVAPAGAAAATMGDYEILREIGRGGMGVVYEARHLRLGRRVALKMIKAGDLASVEEIQRFQAEARHVASLQHANIVQIFEVGELDGRPFLALEFVDGTSVDQMLARSPLAALPAARLLETLAGAMHHAHRQDIIHRDLKPANVLLQISDCRLQTGGADVESQSAIANLQSAIPKITDFGLAKRLGTPSDQTHAGAILGTPSYMAPEQAAGLAEAIGPATDVYALGAILYEVLTGRPPFKAASPLETLNQVRNHEPVPPRRLQPQVPIDLQTICLKCLHKEPAKRYASAQELADDLGRFVRGEPIHARPVGQVGRLLRWCRRNPVVAGLTSVAVVLCVAVAALLFAHFAEMQAAEAREEGRREEILRSNVREAEGLASTILLHLQHLANAVEATAQQAELRDLLKQPESEETLVCLKYFFENVHKEDPKRGIIGLDGKSAFHTWHVLNKNGKLLADVPEREDVVAVGKVFKGRDYFQGALRNAREKRQRLIHISRVYQSSNDKLYKFTLSAPVLAGPEPDASVLGVVCATLPTKSTLGALRLFDKHRTAVLVNRADTDPPQGDPLPNQLPRYRILLHPAYQMGEKAVFVAQDQLRMIRTPRAESELQFASQPERDSPEDAMNPIYQDPLGQEKEHQEYAGTWLAGFAQVGNTELLVIVQQRGGTSAAASAGSTFWPIVWLGVAAALMLSAVAWARFRNRQPAPAAASAQAPATQQVTSVTQYFVPNNSQQDESGAAARPPSG